MPPDAAEVPGRDAPAAPSKQSLGERELRVLELLEEQGPMDAVRVAAAALLSVSQALEVLHSLRESGFVELKGAEPVHERYGIDTEELEKVLS